MLHFEIELYLNKSRMYDGEEGREEKSKKEAEDINCKLTWIFQSEMTFWFWMTRVQHLL